MADFGNLSDTDDSAVDELISQIKDLSVLEQLSKINTCSFTDSPLPSHLDTRFQRLKSLPILKPPNHSISNDQQHNPVEEEATDIANKAQDQFLLSPSYSPQRSSKKGSELESGSSDSPSPPRRSGCFWCSPKKEVGSKKKKKKKKKVEGDFELGDERYLSGLSSLSVKEQEKMLKKAVKEEERMSREADKIVTWAKQASSKLSVGDEFSDDDVDHDKTKYL